MKFLFLIPAIVFLAQGQSSQPDTKQRARAARELAKEGEGVRIFIGSENRLFSLSGSSIVAAPYANAQGKIVGVIGVLGPTRLNYGRIIPMVDHTAKVIGRLLA